MGFLKFLGELAKDFLEPSGTKYNVECKSFELFEIGTVWRGTARVHGAGAHVETVSVNVTTTVFLPDHSDNSKYTERGLLRRDLREWAGKEFALSGEISRDMVILNDGENCLSVEGYVKKVTLSVISVRTKGLYQSLKFASEQFLLIPSHTACQISENLESILIS